MEVLPVVNRLVVVAGQEGFPQHHLSSQWC
jgi:hypothetical protein